jgi:hypothetical protein
MILKVSRMLQAVLTDRRDVLARPVPLTFASAETANAHIQPNITLQTI